MSVSYIYKTADGKDDEYYTPIYAITPLLNYLIGSKPYDKVMIWCPFDTEESNFVKVFRKFDYEVIATHIDNGVDFFTTEPPECDYIISNPPYTRKSEAIERCFEIGKPFALLVGENGLFGSKKKFNMFKSHPFEIMHFDGRVDYVKGDEQKKSSPPFKSVYVCSGVLPKQMVFQELDKTGMMNGKGWL